MTTPAPRTGGAPEPAQPQYRVWTWEWGTGRARGGRSFLGALLLVVGVALFINQVNPALDLGSIFLLGLGIGCAAAWLVGGWKGATVPAHVFLALGIQGLLSDIGELRGPGWSAIAIAIGLLLAWLIGYQQHRRRTWALWIGAILGLYGLARLSNELYPGVPDVSWLAAVVLIVVGIGLLMRRRADPGVTYW
jgi:hypothetical protein